MRRLAIAVIATVVLLAAGSATAARSAASPRVALVIGNSAYRYVDRLRNPDNDARLMAATLRRLGFVLIGGGAQLDLDRAGTEAAIRRFRDAIGPGSVAFFYYSGHGVQVDGANYLVPVSAAPATAADVPRQMVAADLVLQDMADAGAALNIVVLDACRNNPFATAGTGPGGARGLRPGPGGAGASSHAEGLAEMHAPQGTLISFATQPGSVAFDGAAGAADSPYTASLAEALRQPGLDVVRAFNRAGIEVGRLTGRQQEPWLAISPMEDEVFLAGQQVAGVAPLPAMSADPKPMAEPRAARMQDEEPAILVPAQAAGSLACPAAGLQATRNDAEQVLYQGAEAGSPVTCVADVGGAREVRVRGIWPANWPGATAAAAAMSRVLAGGAGSHAGFELTADVNGTRDTVMSEGWQFTLINEGLGTLAVGGVARPVARLRWDERDISHPYHAQAEIAVDVQTGAVLAQSFRVLIGGSAASYEFWSRYQGGVGGVPDFRVTALR